MKEPKFKSTYEENVKYFDSVFGIGTNYDFVGRERVFGGRRARCYFIDSFANSAVLDRLFVYLAELESADTAEDAESFISNNMPHTEVSLQRDAAQFIYAVMSGTMGMIVDGFDGVGIITDIRTYPMRSVGQSENDRILRGAHDSFTETVKQNTTLVRRRIRDPRLTFRKFTIGTTSKTDVVLSYIEGKADSEYVDALAKKLESIRVDALTLGQQSLAECLVKKKWYNPFPKFRYTERPDSAAAHGIISPPAPVFCFCLYPSPHADVVSSHNSSGMDTGLAEFHIGGYRVQYADNIAAVYNRICA